MSPLASNVIAGIVSGLLATLLTIGFRSFWLRVVIPWFEELVYKDARIEGVWYCASAQEVREEQTYTATITRNAHKVSAVMVCGSGEDQGQSYRIEGIFKNLILSATYESLSRTSLDRGALSLMLKENGDRLVGYLAFYHDRGHKIDDLAMIWFRHKEHFDRFIEKKVKEKEEEEKRREEEARRVAALVESQKEKKKKEPNQ
ncbi:MAG: hypothetical protein KF715_00315 [Candidatus Didemnitutus sp.]|nr:hypothetical protein [Candidatus Didemnitutus sp.]